MILYSDLDETLIALDRAHENAEGFVPIRLRPGVERFLADLSKHGDVVLISQGTRPHVERGIELLGKSARWLRGIITREDTEPIQAQIDVVEKSGLPEPVKSDLYQEIPPLFEPGFVFDDFPVGSWMYAVKGLATATPPERWIQVEAFEYGQPDRGGLRKAYMEFTKRLQAWSAGLSGTMSQRASDKTGRRKRSKSA